MARFDELEVEKLLLGWHEGKFDGGRAWVNGEEACL
jgi:hypothetical protein